MIDLARFGAPSGERHVPPHHAAVFADVAALVAHRLASAAEHLAHARFRGRRVVGVDKVVDVPPGHFGGAIAEHLRERAVDREELAGRSAVGDADGGILERAAVALLQLSERRLESARSGPDLGRLELAPKRRRQPPETLFADVLVRSFANRLRRALVSHRSGHEEKRNVACLLANRAQHIQARG